MAVENFKLKSGIDVPDGALIDGVDISAHTSETGIGKHVPGGGSSGQFLRQDGSWANPPSYTHPNHSGDVTSVGDGAQTIAANAVSNTKLADMASQTIKGRNTANTGDPEDLTIATVKSMLGLQAAAYKGTTNAVDTSNNLVEAQAVKTYVDNAVTGLSNDLLEPVQDIASLKAINTTSLTDKIMILVEDKGLYRLDKESSATGNDNTVVSPTTGTGRWLKISTSLSEHANLDGVQTIGSNSLTDQYHVPNKPGNTTHFLRGDGSWAVPPDTNTVYTHPTQTAIDENATASLAVISRVQVNTEGHVTNVDQKTLTIPDPTKVNYPQGYSDSFTTSFATTAVTVTSFAKATYRSAKIQLTVTDITNSRYETLELMIIHDGTNVRHSIYGVVSSATPPSYTLDVTIDATNVMVRCTGTSASNKAVGIRQLISV